MDILERIKKLAASRNLSINSLEEKLGFARGYLYTWKKKTPGIDRVQKVADFFDVSVDYLLGRTNVMHPSTDNEHINVEDLVDNAAMLTSRDHALSDEDRAAIKAMLAGYLNSKEGQRRLRKYGDESINGK